MKIKSSHFKKQFDLQKAELIGQGNFAQVFRVFDSDFHDSIAIRKVKKNQADMEDIIKEKHINQELRKVENENILKIFDIIDQPEAVWYITEYCSGGSLWDALNLCKDNKMNERQALECVLQISKGVQELHNHRITHRDLKPQNILLKTKYVIGKPLPLIKLADFGLSTQKLIMETIAGTKQYIAPQQAKFHNYTNAVDVWSLGIIFDEILHGTPFYSGEDNKEVFNKILKMPFKIRDQNIRESIQELLLSLLKKKPYQRPIIAVIRSTVEKIIQQIQTELSQKTADTHSQKHRRRKSSNQTKGDFSKNSSEAKLNSVNSPSKENLLNMQSRKVYESGTVQRDQQQKVQKTWKSNLVQDLTPTSRHKQNIIKQQLGKAAKINAPIPKVEVKPPEKPANHKDNRMVRHKSIVDDMFDMQKKDQTKTDRNSTKKQSPVKTQPVQPIQEKLNVYKVQRKKMIASHVKKQEYKHQVIDLNTYKIRIFNSKKQLLQKALSAQKIIAFLPNTQLAVKQFQQLQNSTDQPLNTFKKKYSFLNYINNNQDYQIRLMKGATQLQNDKNDCLEQLKGIQQNFKKTFLDQIDNYIDQYIDKVLK